MSSVFQGIISTDSWLKENVAIAWLENNQIRSKTLKPMLENIVEHQVLEMFIEDFNQVYGSDINDCLEKVLANGQQYAFVLKVGSFMHDAKWAITTYFKNAYQGEKVVGHILDRKDGYYEMHPQAFMIDAKWWAEKGKPSFGETARCTWSVTEPIRSKENYHDDYTPLYVNKGTELKQYNMKYRGADWIKLALEEDALGVWPEMIRNNKDYIYPEVPDYMFKIDEIYQALSPHIFYAANTENIHTERRNHIHEHETVICSAGGAAPWLHAYANNLRPNGHLWIYDVSALALQFQYNLHRDWDGTNYHNFLQNFLEEHPQYKRHVVATPRVKEYSDWIDSLPDFAEWFQESRKTVNVKFTETNILNTERFVRQIQGYMNPGSKVFLHTSNIFCYHKTSYLLSYNEKYKLWEYLNKAVRDWKINGVGLTCNVFFNDAKREVFEMLPWYKKF